MMITMLKSKVHRATVTMADLNYAGSLTLDLLLIEAAGFLVNEQVHVLNINTGARFVTYLIPGERGSGTVCLNGAAAHKVSPGDIVIIACYGMVAEELARGWQPDNVYVDAANRIARRRSGCQAA